MANYKEFLKNVYKDMSGTYTYQIIDRWSQGIDGYRDVNHYHIKRNYIPSKLYAFFGVKETDDARIYATNFNNIERLYDTDGNCVDPLDNLSSLGSHWVTQVHKCRLNAEYKWGEVMTDSCLKDHLTKKKNVVE